MKLRYTNLVLLICLSVLTLPSASIASTVNLYSQENEYRQVDLSVLGVATGPYSSPTVKDIQTTLTQPITLSTSVLVPQVSTSISISILELGIGLSQRAQLFKNGVDISVVYLSVTSIQYQNDGTVIVTEIATYKLPGLLD